MCSFFTASGNEETPWSAESAIQTLARPTLMSQKIEEAGKFVVEIERHLLHLRRIGPDLVAENIVGREADDEKIGGWAAADVFVNHQLFGELEFVLVAERGGADDFIEAGVGAVFTLAMRGRAQNRSLRVFPLTIPIFLRATRVEILHPLRQVAAVVGGRDPGSQLFGSIQ